MHNKLNSIWYLELHAVDNYDHIPTTNEKSERVCACKEIRMKFSYEPSAQENPCVAAHSLVELTVGPTILFPHMTMSCSAQTFLNPRCVNSKPYGNTLYFSLAIRNDVDLGDTWPLQRHVTWWRACLASFVSHLHLINQLPFINPPHLNPIKLTN